MTKFNALIQSNWFILVVQTVICLAFSACLLVFPKKFIPNWSPVEIILMDVAFIIGSGILFCLCFLLKKPDFSLKYMLFWFFMGAIIFSVLFFVLTGVLNSVINNRIAGYCGLTLVVVFTTACIVTQDVFCFARGQKFLLVAVAALSILIQLASIFFSFALRDRGWLFKFFSEKEITFETASYEELAVTQKDRSNNEKWFNENVLNAVKNRQKPAFDFSLGGKRLSDSLNDWTQSIEKTYDYADGKGTTIVLFNNKEKIRATVEAVWYEKTATFEWTVYLKNVGETNSSVVSDFYPLDITANCAAPTLYYSNGSDFKNDDFALRKHKIPSRAVTLQTKDGRTSQDYLPFFNIAGKSNGFTVGIGWSGEWKAAFSSKNGTNVRIGQKTLCGYLTTGEEIRSPLISLSFYEGKNPLKGFNTFRQRVFDSLPDEYGNMKTFAFAGAEGEANMSFVGEEGTKRLIEIFEKEGLLSTVDYAWYDAGWFDVAGLGEWAGTSGDWEIDTRRYPNGLKAVSDYLHERNVGFILWYEPERIPDRSKIYQIGKKNNWLLDPERVSKNSYTNYLWNMGDTEANDYMCKHIGNSIEANGVDFYRQDFNINPGSFWEKADKELYDGRTGFCENKYVSGEYRFLDYLKTRFPDLLIDNCASGGRRIDLEMCRRSVPLWRSDYNCVDYPDLEEASQYQTYGISLWLPLSNCGDDWTKGEYDYRSCLGSIIECYPSFMNADMDGYKKYIAEYEQIKEYFLQNYYPLTPCTVSSKETVAMQFGTEKEGTVLVFARNNCKEGDFCFTLNGLDKNKNYTVKTIEGDLVASGKGSELMTQLTMRVTKRTAYILVYKEV